MKQRDITRTCNREMLFMKQTANVRKCNHKRLSLISMQVIGVIRCLNLESSTSLMSLYLPCKALKPSTLGSPTLPFLPVTCPPSSHPVQNPGDPVGYQTRFMSPLTPGSHIPPA